MKVKYSVFFRYSGRTPTWGELLQIGVTEFFSHFILHFLDSQPKSFCLRLSVCHLNRLSVRFFLKF